MPDGIISNVTGKGKVALRVRSHDPYTAEITSDQIKILEEVAEKFGSRIIRTTPRQAIEIPDIDEDRAEDAAELLKRAGFVMGASGNRIRNVFACSRWCMYNVIPVTDISRKLVDRYGDYELPGKLTISASGCDFSCARSRTSDIGIIAKRKINVDQSKCIKCNLCVKDPLGCQVAALTVDDNGVEWNGEKCINCGFCSNVCPVEAITREKEGVNLYLGGGGGLIPREAILFKEFISTEEMYSSIDKILKKYQELAKFKERLGSVIERVGQEEFQ